MRFRILTAVATGMALIACSGSTEPGTSLSPSPGTSLSPSSLSGAYSVTLAATSGSLGPACDVIKVIIDGQSGTWSGQSCHENIVPAGLTITQDTVALLVTTVGATRPFKFASFTGTPSMASSEWDGGYCYTTSSSVCVRGHGIAEWRRP